MQIISWNVASIRARLPLLLRLLQEKNPDVVLLQEIKTTAETFPFEVLRQMGYFAYMNGQKGFNGVAILSKNPMTDIQSVMPDFPDSQARFLATRQDKQVFICVYVPNGAAPYNNPSDNSRFLYKLEWYSALIQTIKQYIDQGFSVVLGGDFNVIETDEDVYDPDVFRDGPLMVPPVRQAFHKISELPFINTLKFLPHSQPLYSYWDFQMRAFLRDWGILLDYIFIPSDWKMRFIKSGVYKEYRAAEKPSDHAPVYCVVSD